MSLHSVYDAMFAGFNDKLNDLPSRLDDYDYFTGPRYEIGRHLATWLTVIGEDTSKVTSYNIMQFYAKYQKEIYPKHVRQLRRARN
jgi:hypothetical protein